MPVTPEQVNELERELVLARDTIGTLTAQVLRLGQCVRCGELDEQDGVRIGGEFYCCGPKVDEAKGS